MRCPKCGEKSKVTKTIYKKEFTIRYRTCNNNKCKNRFKTMEQISTDWVYKSIVMRMKDMLKDVK